MTAMSDDPHLAIIKVKSEDLKEHMMPICFYLDRYGFKMGMVREDAKGSMIVGTCESFEKDAVCRLEVENGSIKLTDEVYI